MARATEPTHEPRRGGLPQDEAFLRNVGDRVRLARAGRGMTRKILAAASGVSERYLADLERGVGNASLLVLKQIADALGMLVADLIADSASPTPALQMALARVRQLAPNELADLNEWIATRLKSRTDATNGRIALIGLRGAGKTTLGENAAAIIGIPFIELDREIERAAGMELAEIFASQGQAAFRRLEFRALQSAIDQHDRAIIATGGSLVTEPATYDLLRATCFVVCLTASPELHMSRVISQGDLRPMEDNPRAMEDLNAILESRAPLYALADAAIDTSDGDADATLSRFLALIGAPR